MCDMCHRVNIWEQRRTQLAVFPHHLFHLFRQKPRLQPVVPSHILYPRREKSIVQAGGRWIHITGDIGMSAKCKIEHGNHGIKSAAGIAGPRCRIFLHTGIDTWGVNQCASTVCIRLKVLFHLSCIQNRINIVYLVVQIFPAPKPVGMVQYLRTCVKFECGCAVIDKSLQMFKPRFVAFGNFINVHCIGKMCIQNFRTFKRIGHIGIGCLSPNAAFFLPEKIIIDTKPETQLEPHIFQRIVKGLFIRCVLRLPLVDAETFRRPCLFRGKVIGLAHPLRFQSDHIARDIFTTKFFAIIQHRALICHFVHHKCHTVKGLGHDHRSAGDSGRQTNIIHNPAALRKEHIKIHPAFRHIKHHQILVGSAHIIGLRIRAVDQNGITVAAEYIRDRSICADIDHIELCNRSAARNALPCLVPNAVQPFIFLQRNLQTVSVVVIDPPVHTFNFHTQRRVQTCGSKCHRILCFIHTQRRVGILHLYILCRFFHGALQISRLF